MLEQRENAALLEEAHDERAAGRVPDQLERHALLELAVGTLGEVDRAHSAVADLSHDAKRADAVAER